MKSNFDRSKYHFLSTEEAETILKNEGYNELPSTRPRSVLYLLVGVLKEPMFLLLIACSALYIVLGDHKEGFMLMSSILLVIAITLYQERRTAKALDSLRELSSPRALVIRDGKEKRIPGRDVVKGDIIVLQEGDRVPADALIIESLNLKIDESLLTGESFAVEKRNAIAGESFAFRTGEDTPFIYSGTMIVHGNGIARVHATGTGTEIGKIGKMLGGIEDETTLLQKQTRKVIRTFSVIGLSMCLILTIIYGLVREQWLDGVLAGLSLAMAILPEEFAVVLTIFMAIGAWRISKKNVLTRKPSAIEVLGSVTVLCTDKTGTLTLNKMSVASLFNQKSFFFLDKNETRPDQEFHSLIEYSILASQQEPFDPMEKAMYEFGNSNLTKEEQIHKDWKLVKEYPLSSSLMAMTHVFEVPGNENYIIATKGSPEAIMELCGFSESEEKAIIEKMNLMAGKGLRVIGVAGSNYDKRELPAQQKEFKFNFLGLIGLEDPLRSTINDDLKLCYTAGVRVIMITGDSPSTAQNIAERMGLKNPEQAITGDDLERMSDQELKTKITTANIFARVLPEQKLRIVQALKENGEIIAMTGDGVNDAPAIRAAHVGIAMGNRGTDVAREAASLVLLDDNFSSIISAIRMGRRIYDNLQKAIGYIFSIHIPIAGLTLLPVFFGGWPVILFPLHIAFMELITDPACSLVFEGEKEESNIMNRPPRPRNDSLFGAKKIFLGVMQGLFVLIFSFAVYLIAIRLNKSPEETRTLTFATLFFGNIGLILINRSWTKTVFQTLKDKNKSLKWVMLGAATFLIIILYLPPVRKLFLFDVLNIRDLVICFIVGVLSVIWFEIFKKYSAKVFYFRTAKNNVTV